MTDLDKYSFYKLNFTGALILFLGVIIGLAFLAGFTALQVQVFGYSVKTLQETMLFTLVSYLSIMIFPILAYDLFVVRYNRQVLNFNMKSSPFGVYLMIFPMMFGMMLIAEYVTELIPTEGGVLGEMYEQLNRTIISISKDKAGILVLTVLFAPLLEEILFRGIIQKGMINNGVKPWAAILVSSLIFGLFHLNPWQLVGATFMGVVLGMVYHKTQSLLMPILLHAFNNFIAAFMLIEGDFDTFSELLKLEDYGSLALGLVLFAGLLLLFLYYSKRRNK